ncbi:Serine/threonine-protein phosphatase 2A activator 1 [Penicillium macrosclerotiorum]|uniref:Serine/threonine-protein phosphatase 2A activator 1 n=1 Tax=Penicillium macrosclerotiorum TaxID=303699 RepID=UPI00254926E4|nr:Serine/threonine-protein phosphatase 2A activator 1 [Penicillium macrosclerotiorum]KAJ5669489.1 Serine/threonine-protein phosphatase 2A activator 1 [Penicillium macrosclerotiorum]
MFSHRATRILPALDPSAPHTFIAPKKRIHESQDVSVFLISKAYADIMTFILQLNRSMFPESLADGSAQTWPLNSDAVQFSAPVRQLQRLLSKVEDIINEVPPDTGPRRFGNISFRKWHEVLEDRASDLLRECLSIELLTTPSATEDDVTAESELKAYFLGSWGSGQRLDYGTGHELSFLAFLGAIWKLNGFPKSEFGVEERAIVLGVIEPYLELVRTLIKTYTLEPAGSHGVWGLDDHSFIPYVLGSAQLSPAISVTDLTPEEGSLPNAPDPGGVAKHNVVEREREMNLYFSAIGFIYDVKKGPFWEHSPMLYDISGIRAGWGKINKGMVKMYNAEVLSKFPVVQHFPFGSLFSFDRDPNAIAPPTTIHTTSGPQGRPVVPDAGPPSSATTRPNIDAGTSAPWVTTGASTRVPPSMDTTAAPWATGRPDAPLGARPVLPDTSRLPPGPMAPTRAPWVCGQAPPPPDNGPTKAPWAKRD